MTVNEDVIDVHLQANEGDDEVNVEQPNRVLVAAITAQTWFTTTGNQGP